MKIIAGGITSPKGFLANGVACGLKRSGRPDLAVVYSHVPAIASAAFTTNQFVAAPVVVSRRNLNAARHQAVIVNSGNANCANGRNGILDAEAVVALTAKVLDVRPASVLAASTGIIGRRLAVDKVKRYIPLLAAGMKSSPEGGTLFARAIMTTDTVKKEFAVKVRIGKRTVTIGAAVKGVGMLHPDLAMAPHATMLAFVTTDCAISRRMLDRALLLAIGDSFNMVSVDGDMSTNDSVFVLANGLADNRSITGPGKAFSEFSEALTTLLAALARELARDGEGATKLMTISVRGAKSPTDARKIARKVSTSNLLKCAVYGEDPNWGRIVASAGAAGVRFDAAKLDVYLEGTKVLSNGMCVYSVDLKRLHKLYEKPEVGMTVDLKSGRYSATAFTCDFSEEYVKINSEYST